MIKSCSNCHDWFWAHWRNRRATCSESCARQRESIAASNSSGLFKCGHRPRTDRPRPMLLGMLQGGRNALGVSNKSAASWSLRDPNGKIFRFRNLYHFIRRHRDLFTAQDVENTPRKSGSRSVSCLAVRGLSSLSPRNKTPKGSWHGWTWVSIHERRFNDGMDLLARNPS